MNEQNYAAIIVGGGMVGLSVACALAQLGLRIAVIENRPPVEPNYQQADSRVSAINLQSQRFLQALDVWQTLPAQARCSLREMQVWDQLGGGEIHFDATDMGVAELGFIVENRALRYALWSYLQQCAQVDLIHNTASTVSICEDCVTLTLANNHVISADLLVAADGGHSPLREQLGLPVKQSAYHQQAIIAVVQTEKVHSDTAYQNFLRTGPVALLPMADPHHMNLIWSVDNAEVDRLLALKQTLFELELMNHFHGKLGKIKLLTERKSIPLVMRHAKQYVQERVALVGDAAHTIHPLAGQGVNLGFADSMQLVNVIKDALKIKRHIGSLRVLRQYERARKGDNEFMLLTMRLFKGVFASQAMPVVQLRSMGLNTTNRLSFLKKLFMQKAMG